MKILLIIFVVVISTNCNPCQFYDLLTCADFLGSWKFVELCEKAHVTHEFTKGNDSKTLFLPSRGALDSIPPAIIEMMSKNKTFLKEVIMYHLVPQKLQCINMKDNSLLPTFQGEQLRVNRYTSEQDNKTLITIEGAPDVKEREVYVGSAKIINADISTLNGVVQIIDTVLVDT
ncbi:Hypothetical predicted protein [Mytilus galloprovincialis]|uniref:FAS1 domain-containing protein n=1 Tax=Mytilus galloprovincialis TaxID=29158 RepID=A0A8B6GC01_MYTGA|nr:Hypothetical predicted protein [Mytilus galloprovincialis]